MTSSTDSTPPDIEQAEPEETVTATPEPKRAEPEETKAVTAAPRKTLLLTEYLNEQVPVKLRAATYGTIAQAVARGELHGIVHGTQKGPMTVTLSNGKEVTRPYAHVLLRNTPDLLEKLDALCITAINKEMVRTAGQSMTVEEILEMGDELDFDAVVDAARKANEKKRKEAHRRTQIRQKTRPGPTTTKKAKA